HCSSKKTLKFLFWYSKLMIKVQQLEEKNRPAFTTLFKKSIDELFPVYKQKAKSFLTSEKHIQELFENYSLGAFDGDSLIGYLTTERPYGGVWYISWLAVSNDYQQKEIGSRLLRYFEDEAIKKGIHNIQLSCEEGNLSFY